MGRPTIFSEELADALCERIASGESLRAICAGDDMPGDTTVFRWLSQDSIFREQYARAKAAAMDKMAEDILHIADGTEGEAGDDVQRAKLRVDTRKWLMSKLAPKKYGDRIAQEVSGPDGGPQRVEYAWAPSSE